MPAPDHRFLRALILLVRTIGRIVPRGMRPDWIREWEAEVRHRWLSLDERRGLDWRARLDLFRRILGALPDAA